MVGLLIRETSAPLLARRRCVQRRAQNTAIEPLVLVRERLALRRRQTISECSQCEAISPGAADIILNHSA
jgi:hypothetical protein